MTADGRASLLHTRVPEHRDARKHDAKWRTR